jgi:hypothetical protein
VGVISISGGPSPSEGFPTIRSLAGYLIPTQMIRRTHRCTAGWLVVAAVYAGLAACGAGTSGSGRT